MVQAVDRVTRERWEQGYTWEQYQQVMERNQPRFQRNYDETELDPADIDAFRRVKEREGELAILAIGEDWCPDVYFNLPIVARIADAVDLPLRIFPRDQHHDLMNRYLKDGQFMSIPVFVFFGRDWRELGHWIERSKRLEQVMEEDGPEGYRRAIREQTGEFRQEVVNELRALLES